MATFLDVGLFNYFNIIFPVLLVFAVVLAILHKTKILGENNVINGIVAIAMALMSLTSRTFIDLINFMAPWFVLAFIFLILLLLLYQVLGATEKDIVSALRTDKTIQWTVFGVAIIILFAGFATVLGQKFLPITQTDAPETLEPGQEGVAGTDFEKNLFATLFNTKVLGIVFIFLIAIFTVAFLAGA